MTLASTLGWARFASADGCTPGAQTECACRGGGKGFQVCADDGSRFLACQCDGSSPAAAPQVVVQIDDGRSPGDGFVLGGAIMLGSGTAGMVASSIAWGLTNGASGCGNFQCTGEIIGAIGMATSGTLLAAGTVAVIIGVAKNDDEPDPSAAIIVSPAHVGLAGRF